VRLNGVLLKPSVKERARRFISRLALKRRAEVTDLGGSSRMIRGWVIVNGANLSYELVNAGLAKPDRKNAWIEREARRWSKKKHQ